MADATANCGHPFDEDNFYDTQSQLYDLKENECIWSEPSRNKLLVGPSKKGKSYCVHRYTGQNCTCYSEAFTIEAQGER